MAKKKQSFYQKNKLQIRNIVLAVCAMLVVYGGFQLYRANQDVKTRQAANVIGEQLGRYIEKTHSVPQNLADAGINNSKPNTIFYNKTDRVDGEFSYCVHFNRANDPSVGKLRQFVNLFWNSSSQNIKYAEMRSVYGTIVVDDIHDTSECQEVTWYKLFPKESITDTQAYADLGNQICGVKYDASNDLYFFYYEGPTFGNWWYVATKNVYDPNHTDTTVQSLAIKHIADPKVKAFDQSCKEIGLANVKDGDRVKVLYVNNPNIIGTQAVVVVQKM